MTFKVFALKSTQKQSLAALGEPPPCAKRPSCIRANTGPSTSRCPPGRGSCAWLRPTPATGSTATMATGRRRVSTRNSANPARERLARELTRGRLGERLMGLPRLGPGRDGSGPCPSCARWNPAGRCRPTPTSAIGVSLRNIRILHECS